jgi:hypothetical protein
VKFFSHRAVCQVLHHFPPRSEPPC